MRDIAIITKIAMELTKNINFDDQMNSVLKIVGKYLNVSRAYIFTDDGNGETISNKYEWCGENVNPEIQNNLNILYKDAPSLLEIFKKEGRIKTNNINELPSDLYEILRKQNRLSIVIYPLKVNGIFHGFIGFDESKDNRIWYKGELEILETLSILVSNVYEKHNILNKIQTYIYDFEHFFDTIEDFIIILNMDGTIIETNKYVVETLGYTKKELVKKNIKDIYDGKNKEKAIAAFENAINGKIKSCNLDFTSKLGRKINVETRTWLGNWNNEKCLFVIAKNISKEQEALKKFAKIFDNNPSIMSLSTVPDGRIVDINKAFTDTMGYSKEEVMNKTTDEIGMNIELEDFEGTEEEFNSVGKIFNENIRLTTKDKKIVDGLISGEIIESRGIYYYLTVMIDISKQKKLQELYSIETKRLESIIDSTRLGTWEWNIKTGKIVLNKRFANLLGYSEEELSNFDIKKWIGLLNEEDSEISKNLMKKHFRKELEYYELDCRLKHKSGNWIWVNNRGKVIKWDEHGNPLKMYGTHTEITEKKIIEGKIKEASIRDPLTNIYNRRYIYERLEKEISKTKRDNSEFSVVILDIDRFKNINDTYGHNTGDYILKEFTKMIAKKLRLYDLLGRYGGEEFIVLLYNTDKSEASKIILRILEEIRGIIFVHEKNHIKFTFSAGISDSSEFNEKDMNSEKIIDLADARMYKAKKAGRNKVVYL